MVGFFFFATAFFFGAALALAAVLLITPGFATDTIGFLLVLPLTRNLIFKFLGKKYTKKNYKDDFFTIKSPELISLIMMFSLSKKG